MHNISSLTHAPFISLSWKFAIGENARTPFGDADVVIVTSRAASLTLEMMDPDRSSDTMRLSSRSVSFVSLPAKVHVALILHL